MQKSHDLRIQLKQIILQKLSTYQISKALRSKDPNSHG